MKKKLLVLALSLVFVNAPGILHAEGNVGAVKDKTATCVGCHGDNGNSTVPTFPKLAQQHASYIEKQLKAFKDGSRSDPMMSGIASTLSDDDMIEIANYYASKKVSANTQPTLPADDSDDDTPKSATPKLTMPELMTRGSALYRNGDLTREVSACIACHGSIGEGNEPAAFPALKSQHADYLIKTLTDFKNGARSNNPENMMHMIAKKMTDEEIKAVSYRISMMK
jgi:cytochrome c553